MVDPAVLERRRHRVAGVQEHDLPVRPMTISGIAPKADARILSRDGKGPVSRILNIPPGWSNQAPGSFNAGLEFFLISGSLHVNGSELTSYSYVRILPGAWVEQIASGQRTVALLFTSSPVRFLTGAESMSQQPGEPRPVVTTALPAWDPLAEPGHARYELAKNPATGATTRLIVAQGWDDPRWRRHSADEEGFVLEGSWRETDATGQATADFSYRAGGYWYRPAGVAHGRAGTDGSAVILLRYPEPFETEWIDEPESGRAATD